MLHYLSFEKSKNSGYQTHTWRNSKLWCDSIKKRKTTAKGYNEKTVYTELND